jgi:FKBP-type peptidyl-prolyl cis-trans isomerase
MVISCTNHKGSVTGLEAPDSTGEALIEQQKEMLKVESNDIDAYITRSGLNMQTTKTGLRYMIHHSGLSKDSIRPMDEVNIEYKVFLLNGDLVYSSDSTGSLRLIIGRSELATGLQEGLQLMKTGDNGLLILPSHLAYGLTGDGDKISGFQPLVIQINSVQKLNGDK